MTVYMSLNDAIQCVISFLYSRTTFQPWEAVAREGAAAQSQQHSQQREELLEMTTEVDVECEGDDCWAVELATAEMPCTMAVVLEAEPQ